MILPSLVKSTGTEAISPNDDLGLDHDQHRTQLIPSLLRVERQRFRQLAV